MKAHARLHEPAEGTRVAGHPSAGRAVAGEGTASGDFVRALQRSLGNGAVGRLARAGRLPPPPPAGLWRATLQRSAQLATRAGVLQATLRVSQPDDPYEREAERVAQQVMSVPSSSDAEPEPFAEQPPRLSRVASSGRGLPRAAEASGEEVGADLERQLDSARGGGSPLPEATRTYMEARFGADFGSVRVHTDAGAQAMAEGLGARAFTQGRDIYVAGGEYHPGSQAGQTLLAHELTHVVQQGAVGVQRWSGPSSGVLGYVQALRGRPRGEPTPYDRAIAEFQDHHATAEMATLQGKLLDPARPVEVRQRDAAASLRRKGKADQAAPPQKTASVNVTIVAGSTRTAADLGPASTIWTKAANIAVTANTVTQLDAKTSKALIGDDLVVDEYSSPSSPTAEELALTQVNRSPGHITVYFVKALSAGSHGEAFWPSAGAAPPSVIVKNGDSPFVAGKPIGHELGHVLTDDGSHPSGPGNLMDYTNKGVGLTDAQVTQARSSPLVS